LLFREEIMLSRLARLERAFRTKRCTGLRVSAAILAARVFVPSLAHACACGCAVFDVGTSSLLPSGPGGTAFFEYDFLDQNIDWSGTSRAPASANGDKEIRTDFFLAGGQYMFNDSWGVMAEIPFADRLLRTEVDNGSIGAFDHLALGDIRLMGVYSGFSPDMSTGILFGTKLPTGDHTYPNFDADNEIGQGSTDVVLGGYHTGALTPSQSFGYFAQVLWEHEVAIQYGYRPGAEFNAALGVSYNDAMLGEVHVAPVFQLIFSRRERDGGVNGVPEDTGYARIIATPGIEFDRNAWKFYADVEVPFYQDMNGHQLVAPAALKFILSRSF
jgi:hypothetical protein